MRYWRLNRQLDPPAYGRLGELHVPTLVVIGSIDMPDIFQIGDIIVQQVPGARKVMIQDVAHMVNMEKPEEFNALVLEFLGGL